MGRVGRNRVGYSVQEGGPCIDRWIDLDEHTKIDRFRRTSIHIGRHRPS